LLERARTVLGKKRNECAPKALAAVEAAIQGVEYALEHEQTDVGQRAEALSDALLDLT
jgi:hypothetical protein